MVHRVLPFGLTVLLAAAGCTGLEMELHKTGSEFVGPNPTTKLVTDNPFANPTPAAKPTRVALSPASKETATRVGEVGQKLLAANPNLGLRPAFVTIGGPQPEIFHVQTDGIYVTEALVKQCATEGQLAAALSHELGKMVAERQALTGPNAPEYQPPMDVRVGSDSGGTYGAADLTHLAELGKYEKERRRPPALPPDPQALARTYLVKAGYAVNELDTVAPLLHAAAANNSFEKQLAAPPTERPWTR
jgi:hypothetical protein